MAAEWGRRHCLSSVINNTGYLLSIIRYCPIRGMGEKPSPLGEDFSLICLTFQDSRGPGVQDSSKDIVDFFTTPRTQSHRLQPMVVDLAQFYDRGVLVVCNLLYLSNI